MLGMSYSPGENLPHRLPEISSFRYMSEVKQILGVAARSMVERLNGWRCAAPHRLSALLSVCVSSSRIHFVLNILMNLQLYECGRTGAPRAQWAQVTR